MVIMHYSVDDAVDAVVGGSRCGSVASASTVAISNVKLTVSFQHATGGGLSTAYYFSQNRLFLYLDHGKLHLYP